MSVVGSYMVWYRFEFDFVFEFEFDLVLVLTRSSDQESESEFEGSWEISFEVSNIERFLSGRHGRRRFLGKGRGEKGEDEYGVDGRVAGGEWCGEGY